MMKDRLEASPGGDEAVKQKAASISGVTVTVSELDRATFARLRDLGALRMNLPRFSPSTFDNTRASASSTQARLLIRAAVEERAE